MIVERASDRALLLRLAGTDAVRSVLAGLRNRPPAGLVNLHPGHGSVLVVFDPLAVEPRAFEESLRNAAESSDESGAPPVRDVEIPVCYEPPFAPDLEDVAAIAGIAAREVIERHAGASYVVEFLGFAPGFPYLSGLPESLAAPRLATPRVRVPAGSVAVAGRQAGIYPVEIPGGWRVIGRTPLVLFDSRANPPNFLDVGDRVRFVPVGAEAFAGRTR